MSETGSVTDRGPGQEAAGAREVLCLHAFLGGQVQGVGMRFTVVSIARSHGLCGWVRNLADGRVEILAEGPRHKLEELLTEIQQEMSGYVRRVDQSWAPPTGQWRGFQISYR
jgi:acylphosphatase